MGHGESEKIGEICGSENSALLYGVGQHYGVAILE